MKTLKIAILGAALLSPCTTFAAYEPMSVGYPTESLTTTRTQEIEGYPNPAARGSCVLLRLAVNGVHRKFIRYQRFHACS